MTAPSKTDILREWFGGERYARDHAYLDTNFGAAAERVVKYLATEAFPQPDCNRVGKEPCGECHLQPGETCDICGASTPPKGVTEALVRDLMLLMESYTAYAGDSIPASLLLRSQDMHARLAALSLPAAKGVTEAATELVNFAWSAIVTDCTESAEYLNELVENLRAALAALSLPAPAVPESGEAIEQAIRTLTNCAQIIDVVKGEWEQAGAWSAWDQSVRDDISKTLAALYASK